MIYTIYHHHKGKGKKKNPYDWKTFIVAVFALVIAGIAAGFSYWQAEIAKDTAQRQLRAYVGILQVGAHENIDTVNGMIILEMDYKIIDYGQTPAKMVQSSGQIEIEPFPLPPNFMPNYSQHSEIKQSGIIFPNANDVWGRLPPVHPWKKEEYSEIVNVHSGKRAYVFMKLTYLDCFNITHHSKVCWFLDPKTSSFENGHPSNVTWADYTDFNDYD